MNPTRRSNAKSAIRIVGSNGETMEDVSSKSGIGEQLLRELRVELADPLTPIDRQAPLEMLAKLLTNPQLSWSEVHFEEKWD